jgi:hypothetical protein
VGECLHILTRPAPRPWSEVKGRGGRSKEMDSRGRYGLFRPSRTVRIRVASILPPRMRGDMRSWRMGIWAETVRFRTGSVRRVGDTPATTSARSCIG